MLFIYGKRKFFIRSFEPLFYECPFCETTNSTEVFIYSNYFHLFWIPVFPFAKSAVAKCTTCNSVRAEDRFGPKLNEALKEESSKTNHPIYSWTLILILLALLVMIIIVAPKK